MEHPVQIFHLAIPTHNLDSAVQFFCDGLNCELARKYNDRITLNFFGHQVVCHLSSDGIDEKPQMYPRHFGMTFREKDDFESLYKRARQNNLKFYKDLFHRFKGQSEEHSSFFLQDPSNNLLEFKYYKNSEMMY